MTWPSLSDISIEPKDLDPLAMMKQLPQRKEREGNPREQLPRLSSSLEAGGFIVMDSKGARWLRTVAFQYNPDTLSRTLAPRGGKDRRAATGSRGCGSSARRSRRSSSRSSSTRPTGSSNPHRTPRPSRTASRPSWPSSRRSSRRPAPTSRRPNRMAQTGTLEVLPLPSPLVLLVLGANRTLPVRDHRVLDRRGGVRHPAQPDPRASSASACGRCRSTTSPSAPRAPSCSWPRAKRREQLAGAQAAGDAGARTEGRAMSDDFPPNSRYYNVPLRTRTRADGTGETFVARRIIPAMERYRAARSLSQPNGDDRIDNVAADGVRRSRAVLAHLRRQRRRRPGRRRPSPTAACSSSRCRWRLRTMATLKGVTLTLLMGPVAVAPAPVAVVDALESATVTTRRRSALGLPDSCSRTRRRRRSPRRCCRPAFSIR